MELGNRQDLVRLFETNGYKRGTEIGVRKGGFSEFILSNTNVEKLYSVDPYTPNVELSDRESECERVYQIASDILKQFEDRSEIIRLTSQMASVMFAAESLDFVYIDALHDFESVKTDIEFYWPKIKSGGILGGHDYDEQAWPGVFKAVNEFISVNSLELNTTGIGDEWGESDGNRRSWFVYKP